MISRKVGVPTKGPVGASLPPEVDVIQDTRGRSLGTLFSRVVLMNYAGYGDRYVCLRLSRHPRQRGRDWVHLEDVDTFDTVDGNCDVTSTSQYAANGAQQRQGDTQIIHRPLVMN